MASVAIKNGIFKILIYMEIHGSMPVKHKIKKLWPNGGMTVTIVISILSQIHKVH